MYIIIIIENCAPFTDSINEIGNTKIDNPIVDIVKILI